MNSIAANGGTAHRVDRPQAGALRLRIASALVLAPLALIFAWAGGWLLTVLVAAAALLMLGEWHSIMGGQAFDLPGVVRGVALFVALFVAGLGHATIAAIVILVLTTLVALAAAWNAGLPRWSAVGIAYIGLPCIALIWLRRNPEGGLGAVFWLFAVVWATDTAAYISGRLIGGPKLAPRFSPNKTWAGLIGGALAAALVGVFAARLMGDAPMLSMALASAGLAVVAQAGDLVESALKRRFGVKDASTLIPGHGGVLDRLDGMLFAAPVFVVLMMWTGGVQSWR